MVLSAYKIMWIMVLFDLPTTTKSQQKRATRFRNILLDEGFTMKQFSVYLKHCPSREKALAIAQRIGRQTPPEGDVSIMFFTDKQFGQGLNFSGKQEKDLEKKPDQFALF